MAEKQPIIVIKKVYEVAGGGHGGSWKVAFADFMTAMMAFFLVMWLLGQSDEVKKNVADYFSTPSIIEYNFSNYGVELTLEKLFLDLINEPLKFFEQFIRPADYTPNVMQMGTKKIVIHHLAEKLGDVAKKVQVNADQIMFEIPAYYLFKDGTAEPNRDFVSIMENLNGITAGLEDSDIFVDSRIFAQSVQGSNRTTARNVGEKRLDLLTQKMEVALEHPTVDIFGKTSVSDDPKYRRGNKRPEGSIQFTIKSKDGAKNSKGKRKLKSVFDGGDESMSVYDQYVDKISNKKRQ